MDQMIRRILELDSATEERLQASRTECSETVEQARRQAAALAQARKHHTRDLVQEFEEQTRLDCEQKIAALRVRYDSRADEMTKQFEAQHDALLDELFEETLREAER